MMLKGLYSPAAALLCAALLVMGCSPNPANTQRASVRAVAVKAVDVIQKDIPRTTIQPATVHAYYRAEIQARVSGYLSDLRADIGDVVEAGAVLAVIDVPEMHVQREITMAEIKRLEAEKQRAAVGVDLADSNVQSTEAKLSQAKAELNRADASLVAAEAEFARTKDLVDRQALERRMLDEARKKRDSELANKEALASAINAAKADVAVSRAQKASAEANVQAATSETEIARRRLDEIDVLLAYATLTAPFAGVVTRRTVDPGDLVSKDNVDGDSLFVVSQVDRVRVQIPVPEADAALVSQGDKVSLSFPSFPGEEALQATVARVSGSLDPSTRTMLVEAELPNPDGRLLPGMFGQATITLATKVAANVLPARAVRFDESGRAYVYVVGQDETVTVVDVSTGLDDGRSIEILDGVDTGQKVVDASLKRFTTGQKVTVLNN